jgi:hypothetical protein
VTLTAAHENADVDRLLEALAELTAGERALRSG